MSKVREIAKLVGESGFNVAETSEFCFAFLNQITKDSQARLMERMLDLMEGEFLQLSRVIDDGN